MNKFVIRRAAAGVVITPLVAVGWWLVNALLIVAGASPSASSQETFSNGLFLGLVVSGLFIWGAVE